MRSEFDLGPPRRVEITPRVGYRPESTRDSCAKCEHACRRSRADEGPHRAHIGTVVDHLAGAGRRTGPRRSDLRMDRGLLQPHPPALRHQLPPPGRPRDHEPGSGAHHRGLTTHPNCPRNRVKLPTATPPGRPPPPTPATGPPRPPLRPAGRTRPSGHDLADEFLAEEERWSRSFLMVRSLTPEPGVGAQARSELHNRRRERAHGHAPPSSTMLSISRTDGSCSAASTTTPFSSSSTRSRVTGSTASK